MINLGHLYSYLFFIVLTIAGLNNCVYNYGSASRSQFICKIITLTNKIKINLFDDFIIFYYFVKKC